MSELKDRYVDIKWVMEYTGLAQATIYQLADPAKTPTDRLIPSYRPTVSRRPKIMFKASEIERWMQRNKTRAS